MSSMTEQYYANAKEAQAKWAEAMRSVFDETKRAFDGQTLTVDSAAAGERVQQGIDQVFDFWNKAIEFNRDVVKKVADANIEYMNVLQRQAEAAGEQALSRFEEARQRAEKVAEQTQDALAKSAMELENSATTVADKASQQFEQNVNAASEQTVKMTQKATDEAERTADTAARQTEKARNEAAEEQDKAANETQRSASRARSSANKS